MDSNYQSEEHFKNESHEMISQFSYPTQQKAVIAINDLFESYSDMSWEFIATALKKKSRDNFEKYGFGIFFNNRFMASVYQQIERDKEAKAVDVAEFFETGELYE